jgi:hypothetical protein
MILVVQIFFSAFCTADVLAAGGVFDVTMMTGSAFIGWGYNCIQPITIKASHLLADALKTLSIFIRDLYWLLKVDKSQSWAG